MSFHIKHTPQAHDRTKHSKGNGGKAGSGIGHHKNKSYAGERSLLYGTGCKRCPDCFTCKLPDCEYDAGREYYVDKKNAKLKEEADKSV